MLTLPLLLTVTAAGPTVGVIEPPLVMLMLPDDEVESGVVVAVEMEASACALDGAIIAANDSGARAAATQRRFIDLLPSPTRTRRS